MKRNCGTVLLILLAALASGCALQPTYERPAAPVADAFPAGPAYRSAQNEPAGATLAAADIRWGDFLLEARPQNFVELALPKNPDLREATPNVEPVPAQFPLPRSAP